jgi:hypothetical protein
LVFAFAFESLAFSVHTRQILPASPESAMRDQKHFEFTNTLLWDMKVEMQAESPVER